MARERVTVAAATPGPRQHPFTRLDLHGRGHRNPDLVALAVQLPAVRRAAADAATHATRRVLVSLEAVGDGHRQVLGPIDHLGTERAAMSPRTLGVGNESLDVHVQGVLLLID